MNCLLCEKEFSGREGQKYCSKYCREKSFRINNPAHLKEYYRKLRRSKGIIAVNTVLGKKNCVVCGKEFSYTTQTKKMNCCSLKCSRSSPSALFYKSKWKHRKRGCPVTKDDALYKDWKEIVELAGNKCVICGSSEYEIDMKVSIRDGGRFTKDNLQPLCHRCNREKW